MAWTPTTFHRFSDEAAWLAAQDAMAGQDTTHTLALDVIGTLYDEGVVGSPPSPLPGFHVNARWRGLAMPAAFTTARIYPTSPDEDFM